LFGYKNSEDINMAADREVIQKALKEGWMRYRKGLGSLHIECEQLNKIQVDNLVNKYNIKNDRVVVDIHSMRKYKEFDNFDELYEFLQSGVAASENTKLKEDLMARREWIDKMVDKIYNHEVEFDWDSLNQYVVLTLKIQELMDVDNMEIKTNQLDEERQDLHIKMANYLKEHNDLGEVPTGEDVGNNSYWTLKELVKTIYQKEVNKEALKIGRDKWYVESKNDIKEGDTFVNPEDINDKFIITQIAKGKIYYSRIKLDGTYDRYSIKVRDFDLVKKNFNKVVTSENEIKSNKSGVNVWLSPDGKLYEFPISQSHQYYINKNFNISIGQAFEEGWTRIVPDNRDTYYATLSINGNKPFEWVWEQLPKEYKQVNIINIEDNEGHSDVIHMDRGGEMLHRDRISANKKIEAEVMEYPAFWIDDSGKTYEVKEDDFTHSEWVLNNITMVSDKIPNIFDYLDVDMAEDDEDLEDYFEENAELVYSAMYENGWTRVRKYNGNKGTLIEVDFPTPDKLKYAEDLVYRRGWKFDYIGLSPMGQDISAIPYDDVMSEKNWMRVYQKYKNMIMNSDKNDNVKVDSAMSTCVYDGDEFKTGTDELYFSMNVDNMKDLIYNPEFSRQLQLILQDKGNSKKPGKWGGSNLQLDHEEEHNTIFRDKVSRDKSNNLDDTMPPDIDLKHYTGILK
jgi:hypothetical protein